MDALSSSSALIDAATIGRRDAVGKKIRTRTLSQQFDDPFAAAGETAARATERFAQRAGNDVDPSHHAAIFVRAAPGLAQKSGGMRIIDHGEGIVFFGQVADAGEVGDRAIHREKAVGRDQAEARAVASLQLRFEIGHVVVFVTKALRFAEPDAVDDAGVIEFIADDGVFCAEQRLEQTAVGVEARLGKESCLPCREIW